MDSFNPGLTWLIPSTDNRFLPVSICLIFWMATLAGVPRTVFAGEKSGPESSPVGYFDLYKGDSLAVKDLPVWRPFSFKPRAIDFVADQPRVQQAVRLELKRLVDNQAVSTFDTGLASIRYQSIQNPYYGKIVWKSPANFSLYSVDDVPLSLNLHSGAESTIRWFSVIVNDQTLISHERFSDTVSRSLDIRHAFNESTLQDIEIEQHRFRIHLKLFDDRGNSVRTQKRTVHVSSEEKPYQRRD